MGGPFPPAPAHPRGNRGYHATAEEEELELALALSREIVAEEERRRRLMAEDEELERVLKLSLQEK